jgi:hypothetical protein
MALVAGGLQLTVQSKIAAAQINPQGNAATVTLELPTVDEIGTADQVLTFGSDEGLGNIYCAGDFDLAPAGAMTIDLFAGTDLRDVFGGTAAFAKLKHIFVSVIDGGDEDGVTIGDAAANPLGLWFGAADGTWTIYPGGAPFLGGESVGVTVDNTAKNILFTNNGAEAVTIRIILAGSNP